MKDLNEYGYEELRHKVTENLDRRLNHDAKAMKQYSEYWTHASSGAVIASSVILLFMFLEKQCETWWWWTMAVGVALEWIATFLMISLSKDVEIYLSDGSHCKGQYFKKILYWVAAGVPCYASLVMRVELKWTTSLWLMPVLLLALILRTFLLGSSTSYSRNSSSGTSKNFSIVDMEILRRDQELAGIDPDKLPASLLDADTVKSMTVVDWIALKRDLEVAGYNVGFTSEKHE